MTTWTKPVPKITLYIWFFSEKKRKLKKGPSMKQDDPPSIYSILLSPGTERSVHVASIPSILFPPPLFFLLPIFHPSPSSLLLPAADQQPMAAASFWLLQRPSPALHNSLSLSSRSSHPSSSACPPLHNKPRDLLLCCASSSGASSSVVTKEQEEPVTAPSEEGSEPSLLSYKDDPNFRYLLSFLQLSIQRLPSLALCIRSVMKIILCCIYTLYFFSPSSSGSMV